jgi:tRNA A-37 threonylcarbamoyl transferase component Bud32
MREMRKTLPDVEIIVNTSRGMSSCNGDVEAAEKKNRPTIEKWLSEHGIKVDGIIFGKPLADLYVDDKAMTAEDYEQAEIQQFHGFSGAKVTRIGNVVIKEADNVNTQAEWYRAAAEHYHDRYDIPCFITVPQVYSVTLGKLYMKYINGVSGVKAVNHGLISDIMSVLVWERTLDGENDLDAYAKYVESRAASVGLKTDIGERLRKCEPLKRRTFCHGDLSLQNIISYGSGYAFIDPSPKQGMESWILDAAKLRASLNILDEVLENTAHSATLVLTLDRLVGSKELMKAVKLAEESHIIRVWYYARKLGKQQQEKQLETYYRRVYGG